MTSRRPGSDAPRMSPREMASLLALVVLFGAVVVARVLVDAPGLWPAAAVGFVLAASWAGGVIGWRRLNSLQRGGRRRAALGWLVALTGLTWPACLAITLPRIGPARVHTDFGLATITFGVAAGACLCLVLAASRTTPGGDRIAVAHTARSNVEIWHLHGGDEDYLMAQCECGWIGTAHDTNDAGAGENARAEALRHGGRLAAGIVDIPV